MKIDIKKMLFLQQYFYIYTKTIFSTDSYFYTIYFSTDGWAKDDLIYQWKEKDPVQVVPGLHLPRFTLEQYKSAYCDVITNTGKFDGLLERNYLIFNKFVNTTS